MNTQQNKEKIKELRDIYLQDDIEGLDSWFKNNAHLVNEEIIEKVLPPVLTSEPREKGDAWISAQWESVKALWSQCKKLNNPKINFVFLSFITQVGHEGLFNLIMNEACGFEGVTHPDDIKSSIENMNTIFTVACYGGNLHFVKSLLQNPLTKNAIKINPDAHVAFITCHSLIKYSTTLSSIVSHMELKDQEEILKYLVFEQNIELSPEIAQEIEDSPEIQEWFKARDRKISLETILPHHEEVSTHTKI